MSPTDHVRTLRDYFNRAIAHGSEAHFDPDDAEDIAEYIEKLKTEVAEMQSKVIAVRLAAKCAAKIRDARIEKLEAALRSVIDWDNTIEFENGLSWGDVMEAARKALEGKMVCEETYSNEGPQCPYCGNQFTADENYFYDEQNYTEQLCHYCHQVFDVEVFTSTSWTCTARKALEGKDD